MRTPLLAALLLAITTAYAADLTFDQAGALAVKDEASLNADQTAALEKSQSKASDAALATCPRPSKAADKAPIFLVFEIDASGKSTHVWLKGDTAVAACFRKTMNKQTYFKPPHAPFYFSHETYWQ